MKEEKGFFICDQYGTVWKNGRQVCSQYFGKLLSSKEEEIFEEVKEKYLKLLEEQQ